MVICHIGVQHKYHTILSSFILVPSFYQSGMLNSQNFSEYFYGSKYEHVIIVIF